jgi:hypothetical protein
MDFDKLNLTTLWLFQLAVIKMFFMKYFYAD